MTLYQMQKRYQLIVADTPPLKEEVFKVRYAVYCQELGYEASAQRGVEQDQHDNHSIHVLLRCPESGLGIGCIRVIAPTSAGFPFEAVTPYHFERDRAARFKSCEVSRAAILPNIRRQGQPSQLLALGLYLAGASVACELNYDYAFALMEPRLARRLKQCGIYFQQVGDFVEYRGKRAPFMIERSSYLNGLKLSLSSILETFQFQGYSTLNALSSTYSYPLAS
jgi:N-acyl amino acid synthase of PEP-CTERM/exosortase system